jgi:hypothetical protein
MVSVDDCGNAGSMIVNTERRKAAGNGTRRPFNNFGI